MGLPGPGSSTSHHRRRSSMLTSAGPSQSRPPDVDPSEDREGRVSPREDGPNGEEQSPHTEDTDSSDLSSIAESDGELDDDASDDGIHDDEETGLTAKQRNERRRRRKMERRRLDARIAGVRFKRSQRLLADKNVLINLLLNAGLIVFWYLFSLSISIYNKWMFSEEEIVFPYPLFTTSLHMLVQFTLAALLLYFIPSFRPRKPPSGSPSSNHESVMPKLFYLTRLVPCGCATSLDIGLGNMALKFISLTFLTMCKSSALAFVLIFAFVFRLETPSVKLIVVIAAMTMGVIMMVAGETAFNALGFALVIASAFFSGFRWALTQILLLRHPATSNPFSTLFFLTPLMFISLLVIALAIEGPAQIVEGLGVLFAARGAFTGALLLIFPGILAFCMISSEFALLKRSSVVTLSICGIFKEVVTISAAGVIFHDQLTIINVSGLIVTIGSIAAYNYMKISKMRKEAQRELEQAPDVEEFDIAPLRLDTGKVTRKPKSGLGLGFGNVDTNRGTYQSVPDDAFEFGPSGGGEVEEDVNITPTNDIRRGLHSFPLRASGTYAAVGGLQHQLSDTPSSPALDVIDGDSRGEHDQQQS